MRVSGVMTRDVRIATPDQTLQEAARMMADVDASILPVGDGDRLVGMTTDRDIAVRGRGGQGPTDTGTRGDVERGQVLLRG